MSAFRNIQVIKINSDPLMISVGKTRSPGYNKETIKLLIKVNNTRRIRTVSLHTSAPYLNSVVPFQ